MSNLIASISMPSAVVLTILISYIAWIYWESDSWKRLMMSIELIFMTLSVALILLVVEFWKAREILTTTTFIQLGIIPIFALIYISIGLTAIAFMSYKKEGRLNRIKDGGMLYYLIAGIKFGIALGISFAIVPGIAAWLTMDSIETIKEGLIRSSIFTTGTMLTIGLIFGIAAGYKDEFKD